MSCINGCMVISNLVISLVPYSKRPIFGRNKNLKGSPTKEIEQNLPQGLFTLTLRIQILRADHKNYKKKIVICFQKIIFFFHFNVKQLFSANATIFTQNLLNSLKTGQKLQFVVISVHCITYYKLYKVHTVWAKSLCSVCASMLCLHFYNHAE